MLHPFSREEMLIGKDALNKLSISKVAVFGIGGVGTFAVEGLARGGIGKFVLVDDDNICLTNINRQLHATTKTVGRSKVDVMRERILEINPKASVVVHKSFYLPGSADELICDDYDYIIDAMDTVTAKIDLIVNAKKMNIPIISCMGAGNKLDPTQFKVADIYDTKNDALARVMRRELRKRNVDNLRVVYSEEISREIVETEDTSCTKGSARTCLKRRKIPGSISFVPSVAGLIISAEVIKDLIKDFI